MVVRHVIFGVSSQNTAKYRQIYYYSYLLILAIACVIVDFCLALAITAICRSLEPEPKSTLYDFQQWKYRYEIPMTVLFAIGFRPLPTLYGDPPAVLKTLPIYPIPPLPPAQVGPTAPVLHCIRPTTHTSPREKIAPSDGSNHIATGQEAPVIQPVQVTTHTSSREKIARNDGSNDRATGEEWARAKQSKIASISMNPHIIAASAEVPPTFVKPTSNRNKRQGSSKSKSTPKQQETQSSLTKETPLECQQPQAFSEVAITSERRRRYQSPLGRETSPDQHSRQRFSGRGISLERQERPGSLEGQILSERQERRSSVEGENPLEQYSRYRSHGHNRPRSLEGEISLERQEPPSSFEGEISPKKQERKNPLKRDISSRRQERQRPGESQNNRVSAYELPQLDIQGTLFDEKLMKYSLFETQSPATRGAAPPMAASSPMDPNWRVRVMGKGEYATLFTSSVEKSSRTLSRVKKRMDHLRLPSSPSPKFDHLPPPTAPSTLSDAASDLSTENLYNEDTLITTMDYPLSDTENSSREYWKERLRQVIITWPPCIRKGNVSQFLYCGENDDALAPTAHGDEIVQLHRVWESRTDGWYMSAGQIRRCHIFGTAATFQLDQIICWVLLNGHHLTDQALPPGYERRFP
ncbi:MAG: hypothetical protein Q9169_004567 [Polycauliona sp. 2 TL-2023]